MTDVVVVGAGPAGLVTSVVLAAYDVDVLLVDKRDQFSTVSRALAFSTRSMELLRGWASSSVCVRRPPTSGSGPGYRLRSLPSRGQRCRSVSPTTIC